MNKQAVPGPVGAPVSERAAAGSVVAQVPVSVLVSARAWLARGWRAVVWYARGLSGESRYDAYVAHARAAHPDAAPMSRSEFWRDEARRQAVSPEGRCC